MLLHHSVGVSAQQRSLVARDVVAPISECLRACVHKRSAVGGHPKRVPCVHACVCVCVRMHARMHAWADARAAHAAGFFTRAILSLRAPPPLCPLRHQHQQQQEECQVRQAQPQGAWRAPSRAFSPSRLPAPARSSSTKERTCTPTPSHPQALAVHAVQAPQAPSQQSSSSSSSSSSASAGAPLDSDINKVCTSTRSPGAHPPLLLHDACRPKHPGRSPAHPTPPHPHPTQTVLSIILGGGAGTRLYPLTKKRAKPAVPLGANYRLIDIPVSNCLNSNINKMYCLTQFNSASLNRHLSQAYVGAGGWGGLGGGGAQGVRRRSGLIRSVHACLRTGWLLVCTAAAAAGGGAAAGASAAAAAAAAAAAVQQELQQRQRQRQQQQQQQWQRQQQQQR